MTHWLWVTIMIRPTHKCLIPFHLSFLLSFLLSVSAFNTNPALWLNWNWDPSEHTPTSCTMKVQTLACPICTHWLSPLCLLCIILFVLAKIKIIPEIEGQFLGDSPVLRHWEWGWGTVQSLTILHNHFPEIPSILVIYPDSFSQLKMEMKYRTCEIRKWLRAQNLQSNWFACEWLPLSSCGILDKSLDSLNFSFFTMKWTQWELTSKLAWGFNEIIHVTPPSKRSHSQKVCAQ